MILIALFIGAILIVAAIRNSQGALFSALAQDVPDFVIWAAAILAIGAIGFIPNLKPVSRGILALVIVVIVMNNYQQILASFNDSWQNLTPSPDAEKKAGPVNEQSATTGGILDSVIGGFDALDNKVGEGFSGLGLSRFGG